jgi:hypothetical protein
MLSIHSIRRAVLLISAFLLSAIAIAQEQVKAPKEVVSDVIVKHRANRGRIRSWTGTVQVLDVRQEADGSGARWRSEATFIHRTEPYAVRWKWVQLPVQEGEKTLSTFAGENGIEQGGQQFQLILDQFPGTLEPIRSTRKSAPADMRGPLRTSFRPMDWLGYRGRSIADYLEAFIPILDQIDQFPAHGIVIAQEGDVVTFSIDGPDLLNAYEIDLAKGANPISYRAERRIGGQVVIGELWQWKYEQKGETWLPVEVHLKHESWTVEANGQRSTAPKTTQRTIRWTQSDVNQPIGDNEFTLDKIGIRPGELVD